MEPSLEAQAWHRESGGLTIKLGRAASVITIYFYLSVFNIELSTTDYSVVSLNLGGA